MNECMNIKEEKGSVVSYLHTCNAHHVDTVRNTQNTDVTTLVIQASEKSQAPVKMSPCYSSNVCLLVTPEMCAALLLQ